MLDARAAARDPRPGLSGVPADELRRGSARAASRRSGRARSSRRVWAGAATRAADLTTLPRPLATAIDEAFRWSTVEDEAIVASDGGQTEKVLHRLSDGTDDRVGPDALPGARRAEGAAHAVHLEPGAAAPSAARSARPASSASSATSRPPRSSTRSGARSRASRATAGDGRGARLTNVVFMGMGEPLLNLDRVLEAVAALNDPAKLGLGARHITVSTSGVVPGIRRLTALGPQFTLAISLHAARDALRDVLVPLNRRWPVEEVVAAARDHARATGRRISYEMTMIGGVNDTDADADAVADLLRGDLAHVNLIPMNPVAHTPWHGQPDAGDRALRRAHRGGRHPGHDPAQPRRRRSGRRAASSPPSVPGAAPRPRSPDDASASRPRARGRSAASAATSRCRRASSGDAGASDEARAAARDAPSTARARVAASILDADLGNLAHAVRRAEREGADRIHLDVMDGHFVPNLTFGAKTIAALRKRTRLPFDAHLMIANPGQLHRRVPRRRLRLGHDPRRDRGGRSSRRCAQIRAAGRAAGLCVKPKTPLTALEPYRELLDIVMVMTVEPGFGGQAFMADVAKAKLLQAREIPVATSSTGARSTSTAGSTARRPSWSGGLGVDILVVGSALWQKGRNMAREIRLIRALADEGYQYALTTACRRSRATGWSRSRRLRRPQARTLREEVEAAGIPVLLFRSREDPAEMDDEIRRWDLLIPASAEAAAKERFGKRRAALARADARRQARRPPPALLARLTCGRSSSASAARRSRVERRDHRLDRARAADPARRRATPTTTRSPTRSRGASPSSGSSRTTRAGRTARSSTSAGRALVVSQFTLYADTSRGRRPGFTDAADAGRRGSALPALRGGASRVGRRRTSRPAGSAPRWRSSSSTTAHSRSGSIRTADPRRKRLISLVILRTCPARTSPTRLVALTVLAAFGARRVSRRRPRWLRRAHRPRCPPRPRARH